MEYNPKFIIGAEEWGRFTNFLEEPPRDLPKMHALLSAPSPFVSEVPEWVEEAPQFGPCHTDKDGIVFIGQWLVDPFVEDVDNEREWKYLCDYCYQSAVDDI